MTRRLPLLTGLLMGMVAGAAVGALCLWAARDRWGGPTVALEVEVPREVSLAGHESWAIYVRGGESSSDSGVRCRIVDADGGEVHGADADESVFDTLGGLDVGHRGLGETWRRLEVFRPVGAGAGAGGDRAPTITCPAPPPDSSSAPSQPPHPPEAYALGPAPNGVGALAFGTLAVVLFVTGTVAGLVVGLRHARGRSDGRA